MTTSTEATTEAEAATEISQPTTEGPVVGVAESEALSAEVIDQAPDEGDDPGDTMVDSDADVPLKAEQTGKPEVPVEPGVVEDDATGVESAVSSPEIQADAPVLEGSDVVEGDDGANGAYADVASLEVALDAYEASVTDDSEEAEHTGNAAETVKGADEVEGAAAGEISEAEDDTGLLTDGLVEKGEDDTAPAESSAPSPCAEASSQRSAGTNADDMRLILASLEEVAVRTDDLNAKIDSIAADVGTVTDQLTRISCKYEMVSSEIESLLADNNSKSILSKTFLLISSVAVVALAAFQVYTFTGLVSTQRQLNLSGRSVMENVAGLNKKMAEYDKNLTKALESSSSPQGPAGHAMAETAAVSVEKAGQKEVTHAVGSVKERVNRLRNGLAERRVIRKETGDWFVYNNKKAEECIADAEVIEVLNNAYRKSGRSLTTRMPSPPHNALCLLKPDGKGGTEVVMTNDFVQ